MLITIATQHEITPVHIHVSQVLHVLVLFSTYRWYWDIVVTTLLIFTVTVSIAFYSEEQLNAEWLTINIIVDFLFLTDVFVNFGTGVSFSQLTPGVCH